jgi:hypothetical protein
MPSAAPVYTSTHALRRSAQHLDQEAGKTDRPAELLLTFYAAECEMKAEILVRYGVRSWDQLAPDLRDRFRHQLDLLAAELRLEPSVKKDLGKCRMRNDPSCLVPGFRVHEVWRYGGRLQVLDEARFASGMRKAIDAVRARR